MTDRLSERGSQQVLEDHIRLREKGDLESDLERNYGLILGGHRTFRGHEGVRESARLLAGAVKSGSYRFRALVTGDRMGYAAWSAEGDEVDEHRGSPRRQRRAQAGR